MVSFLPAEMKSLILLWVQGGFHLDPEEGAAWAEVPRESKTCRGLPEG